MVSIELVVVRTSANHGGTNHENRGCLVQFKRENDIKSKRKRERESEGRREPYVPPEYA